MTTHIEIGLAMMVTLLLVSSSVRAGIYGGGLTDLAVGISVGKANAKAEEVKLVIDAPGCIVKGPDGKSLQLRTGKDGQVMIPKGATFTGQCFIVVKK